MAHKTRRTTENIRREILAAELERLRKENAELKSKVGLLMQGRAAQEQLRAEQAEGERDAMRATWIDPASYAEVMDGYALTLAQSQTQLDAARAQVQRLREAVSAAQEAISYHDEQAAQSGGWDLPMDVALKLRDALRETEAKP